MSGTLIESCFPPVERCSSSMIRNGVSGRWTAVVLAVAGASLTGGIVSYSIAVAAPSVNPEVRSAVAPEGRGEPCEFELSAPDLDWYRQRGDQMQSSEMLPDTVSFENAGATLQFASTKPTGVDPCEGGGDNGGGGGGTPCLSTFGFDPDDYWAVLGDTDPGAASATVFAAPVDTLTALSANDIATVTGCSVTYQWTLSQVDWPFTDILDYWNGSGASASVTGETSTSMTVSGLAFGQDGSASNLYSFLCDGNLVLRVSDGVNDYDITAPPCSTYKIESMTFSLGVGFKYDWKDPWNRDDSYEQAGASLGPGGGQFVSEAIVPTVKPSSPITVTFKVTRPYTLKTGSSWQVNCSDSSVNNVVFSATQQTANSTWVDPSPANERIYCLEEILE